MTDLKNSELVEVQLDTLVTNHKTGKLSTLKKGCFVICMEDDLV